MMFGVTEQEQNGYEFTINYYYEFYMGAPPSDIWEGVNGKVQMRSLNFRTVNMYRMATMYMMKKSNP